MEKCNKCKRIVMGKRKLGLCPVCFSNLRDFIISIISAMLILLLSGPAVMWVILPSSEILFNFFSLPIDFAILFCGVIILIINLATIIFMIYRIISRTKKM